jgi:hypothetical protein
MTNLTRTHSLFSLLVLGAMLVITPSALATVISVGPGAFPSGSPLVTFTGVPDGTEVNGLTSGGLLFNYSLGNGHVVINGGPGVTNNINPPNIVSIGNNTGILTVSLPGPTDLFGYGYALLSQANIANATTITLFSGLTNVGSLSYAGVPDIVFTGGFAGIQSTILFDRAQVTFNSAAAPAFAMDNVRVGTVVPEPSSILLVVVGALGGFWRKHRFQRPS